MMKLIYFSALIVMANEDTQRSEKTFENAVQKDIIERLFVWNKLELNMIMHSLISHNWI